MKTSYRLCSMDATHFSSTYGFSGRHRPQPKARQAADRLVVSGHLCRIGLFNNGARDIEVGPVDRIGAICELGAFPAQACPVRHPRRPPSWFATFSRFRSMIRLTNDSRSVFPGNAMQKLWARLDKAFRLTRERHLPIAHTRSVVFSTQCKYPLLYMCHTFMYR